MTIGTQEWAGLTLAGGRYKVTAKLGEGGMGFVYRALDQNIDADVVIKVPRQSMMDDPEFAARFTREIRSLVKLSHPHIVKVTDVGNFDGIPFAVMQYLAGEVLRINARSGPAGRPFLAIPGTSPAGCSRWPRRWTTSTPKVTSTVTSSPAISSSTRRGTRFSAISASPRSWRRPRTRLPLRPQ